MKPVPPHIVASGPLGTLWSGGAVDRSTVTLRVMAKARGETVDKKGVSQLLGCDSDAHQFKHWSLRAPVPPGVFMDILPYASIDLPDAARVAKCHIFGSPMKTKPWWRFWS